MVIFLIGSLILNIFIGFLFYFLLMKKRKILADHFSVVTVMNSSGILSFTLSMLLVFLVPDHFMMQMFVALVLGMLIGFIFGLLVKYQSLLVGFFHNVISSIMGAMLGMVILNPSLCSLPLSLNHINESIILFVCFVTILFISALILFFYPLLKNNV